LDDFVGYKMPKILIKIVKIAKISKNMLNFAYFKQNIAIEITFISL